MRNKIFTLISALTIAGSLMAAVIGPQSVRVTFNGDNDEGWVVSSGGAITSVANGVANVQMALQTNTMYRADFQYKTSGTFTFDKSKDVVWAIKLTAALPGASNSRKFEINYKNAEGNGSWINGINNPSGSLDCTDGGKIYYFDLAALNKLDALQDGEIKINNIHFIFADAVIDSEADAHYSVDWVASFASVNDLKSFQDWNDEAQDASASLPYLELCFRPKTDGSGYDARRNGFQDVQFEGNYNARFFAVEYFLIDNFSAEKIYKLDLTTTGGGGTDALSVWDFPYQVNYETSASDMITKATAVVGYAPGSTGSMNTPIATSSCNASTWSFTIPADKLTALATIGTKTLVGVLVTSNVHNSDKKGKFASASHTTVNHPALMYTGKAAIFNATQAKQEATLAAAVSNANAGDVITLYENITGPTSRMDIAKALTIQGATGAEKITCAVPANSIMILANGSEEEHTLTFKNLVIDGNNVSRSQQTLEAADSANICLNGVQFINTAYSVVTGDVKNTGKKNIILKGTNSIPNGIYLNKQTRVKHDGATHIDPIKIVLADDYVQDYAIVLTCKNTSLYEAQTASGTAWELYVSNNELKGRVMPAQIYDLTVSAAGMATLVLGFDAELPSGVKAYTLTNNGDANIWAEEVNQITKNQPVLVVAAAATYTFTSAAGVVLDEQADPSYGCLKGTYEEAINVPESAAGVYNYILKNGDAGVGFYKVPDGSCKIRRNRAYLSCGYNSVVASAPMRIRFKEDTATGVEQTVAQQSARKLIINGELFILRDEHLYRIDGRMVK